MGTDLSKLLARHRSSSAPQVQRHPAQDWTFDDLLRAPWPPPLLSRYLVQGEGDVTTMRALEGVLRGRNVGLALNVPALRQSARRNLAVSYLREGLPVYIDSGVITAWRRNKRGPPPPFGPVFDVYDRLLDEAVTPDLLAVTGPDWPGDAGLTSRLQANWAVRMRKLTDRGVRMVVPVQAVEPLELQEAMARVQRLWPGAWVGVPVRQANTTPMDVLVLALLRLGRSSEERGFTPPRLPALHFLGLGGSARAEGYVARVSLIYRILRGPHLYGILADRSDRRAPPLLRAMLRRHRAPDRDRAVVDFLIRAPMDELLRLVSCVQTRAYFPCPPGARGTYGLGHSTVDRELRAIWTRRFPTLSESAPVAQVLAQAAGFVAPAAKGALPSLTERVLGRADFEVDWWALVEEDSDWGELCLNAMEEAERADPCMVPEAWDSDDLDRLLARKGGLDRIEMDATTVKIAMKNGAWIVGGRQTDAPAWWNAKPTRFKFTWNLLMMLWDRWEREQRVTYELPSSYDDEGFVTTLKMKMLFAGRPLSLHNMLYGKPWA